ncbi:unnamed protein product [Effrenium voratum]|nr:unnamed protein product [Effrenium voratum]
MAPLQATVAPSEALRQLVTGEGTEQQVSEAVRALDPATPSPERLWASVAQLLGLSDESRVATFDDELSECPDCMMLWGFRSIYGAEEPLPDASPVLQLARQHRLPEGLAAYALAAQLGSPLGRLAWGEERLGSVPALQRRGSLQPPEDISSNSCAEGLEAAMAVAATAAQEQSSVPQPVDMDYLIQARHEDRQSYALASQLARDGHAEGLAAKAEMLYYGKSAVVSEGYLSAWCWVLPLLIWVLPKLCRREVTRCRQEPLPSSSDQFKATTKGGGPADLAQDVGLAQDLFQEAAEAGHWGAAYAMALIKLDENHSEAQPYLEQVVEQGEEPASSFADYFRHRHGLGVDKDPDRAGQLLERAADMGEPTAQALLAELLTKQEHQAEAWPGHVANLSLAARELRHLANDEAHAAVAVYATLGSLLARFWHRAVLQGCRLPPSVALPRCDQLAEAAGSSGVRLDQAAQLATERVLLMCLLMLTALLLCLLWLGLRFVQQLTIAVAKIEMRANVRLRLELSAFVLQRIPSFAVRIGEVLKELDVNDTVPDKTTLNVNAANLAGVMWYLHNEVVERTPRKFGITKIIRFKAVVQTRATQPLWEKGMNFGVRFAFDSGQATGPFECGRDKYGPKLCQGPFNRSFDVGMHNGSVVGAFEWDTYGYFVGCNKLGHFPFPTYKIYYPGAVWWSLPGPCPSKNYTDWTDWCKEREPGGYCDETPTGQGNCTWTYEDAGEITIDELTGIRNYSAFMASGRKEYMRGQLCVF